MNTILVVDDDPHIRKLIKLYLENSQFSVVEAKDGQEALDYVAHTKVDLMIVDVMMPRIDGIELTEDVRAYLDIPILMVTAKGESRDKVNGFQAGTDDYLVKPFDPVELVLRVKSLLKRYNVSLKKVVQLGDVFIDLATLTVSSYEQTVHLKKKECELLFMLASLPGRIFTRTQLIESLWGIDYAGDERTVDVHIKRLRERIEPFSSLTITTVRGLGYRLEDKLRLSKLSDNLLRLASLDSENHPFHPAMYRLDEQLRRMILVTEPLWAEKNLQVELDLQDCQLKGDQDLFEQVWQNLINNAINTQIKMVGSK